MEDHIAMLKRFVGEEIGLSPWINVDQNMLDAHAHNTGDGGWIHTDPKKATQESPYGCTIAQNFLLMSLLTDMSQSVTLPTEGVAYRTVYGIDRLRVLQPVLVGSRVRGRFELKKVTPKTRHSLLTHLDASIEIEGDELAPAIVAECIILRQLEK